MLNISNKRKKRANRVRYNLVKNASANAIRLVFVRSNKYLYFQAVRDGRTLVSLTTSTRSFSSLKNKKNILASKTIGEKMASLLKTDYANSKFFFDRGARKYHGKVKACLESARKNGLNI
jgi:large subunit ribosomal protein L18